MPYYLKILNVFLRGLFTCFFTSVTAHLFGPAPVKTIVIMVSGGIIPFIFFYYLTNFVLLPANYLKPKITKATPGQGNVFFDNGYVSRQAKKKQYLN